jgi:hypothetical protein
VSDPRIPGHYDQPFRFVMQVLGAHIVQNPDAARGLRHGQHQLVLSEGKVDCRYVLGDHEGGILKRRNLKDVANHFSSSGIEAQSPDIVPCAQMS